MTARRVCLVACDLLGPIRNGGIGTAFTALAELLAEEGHEVTILYPSNFSDTQPISHWIEVYARAGIRLESLFATETGKELAYLVYRWLKEQPRFDAIHYHDWLGIGFWTAAAKRQGLAFRDTMLVCQAHGQTLWHLEHSGEFVSTLDELATDFLERRSVELADVLFSPSRYMIDWMETRGWRLPEARFVSPNLLPRSFPLVQAPPAPAPVDELVFFGRLETRKGLDLFCRAIDPLARRVGPGFSVTFLGKTGRVGKRTGLDYIERIAERWNAPHRVLSDLDVFQANAYLRGPGRLAVIASAMENSPYTVLECLASQVPFLAADVGGTGELVAAEDRAHRLFPREQAALQARLEEALGKPPAPARPAVDLEENRRGWASWCEGLVSAAPAPPPAEDPPLVSVCMSTFDRPELCALALRSLAEQSYPRVEVVLVDDASPSERARLWLDEIRPDFQARGWTLIENETELWTGAARNLAASRAHGDYLMFMDDDNVARPHEIETFVRAARATGADVLTCHQQPFAGLGEAPPFEAERPIGFMPVGPNLPLALYENCLGDLNMMVRRTAWQAMGGFTEDRCGCEDYEFLARAVLGGYRLECLPEILFCYRISDGALARRYDEVALYRSFMRALRPFSEAVPESLRLGLIFAATSRRHAERMAGHGYWGG